MIRLLMALAIGAGAAAVLFTVLTGSDGLMWVWITAIVILSLGLPVLLLLRSSRMSLRAAPADVDAARRAGRGGIARVDAARLTGLEINNVPQYELELSVATSGRPPYRTTARHLIDPVSAASFGPGTLLNVVRLHEDDPRVAIVPGTPPVRTTLPPTAAIDSWVPRGRRPGDPLLGVGRQGRGVRSVAYVACAVLGAAVVVYPTRAEFAVHAETLLTSEDHASLFAPGRAEEAIAALEAAAPSTDAFQMWICPQHLRVDLATSPGADTVDDWQWSGGFVSHLGPGQTQPVDPEGQRWSLTDVDWAALPAMFRQALEHAHLSRDELTDEPYAWIDAFDGTTVIRILLPTDYETPGVTFTVDGTLVEE